MTVRSNQVFNYFLVFAADSTDECGSDSLILQHAEQVAKIFTGILDPFNCAILFLAAFGRNANAFTAFANDFDVLEFHFC